MRAWSVPTVPFGSGSTSICACRASPQPRMPRLTMRARLTVCARENLREDRPFMTRTPYKEDEGARNLHHGETGALLFFLSPQRARHLVHAGRHARRWKIPETTSFDDSSVRRLAARCH